MEEESKSFGKIMEEIQNNSEYDLEDLPYRMLQQIAKSMSLPSNVKKIYLVQLIYAKTHKTEAEVQEIVQRVRYERHVMSQTYVKRKGKKKLRLQAMEVSSSNTCMSPPIDLTPKRSFSPEMINHRPIVKYHPPRSPPLRTTSDRVLRSYNVKSYKRPNYSLINDSVVELVTADRASSPKDKQISIISHAGRLPRFNVTARCVLKKLPPAAYSPRSYLRKDIACATTHTQTTSKALVPTKRVRTLSGISPLAPPTQKPRTSYEYVRSGSVGFIRTDGKISKINALVQKATPRLHYNLDLDPVIKNVEVTIQDLINSNIDAQTFTNPSVSEYMLTDSNMADNYHVPLTDVMPNQKITQSTNEINSFSVYYHKKIRAEQTRTKKPPNPPSLPPVSVIHNVANQQLLPKYSDVISKLSDAGDVIRPCARHDNTSNMSVVHKVANEQRLPKYNDVFSISKLSDAGDVTRPRLAHKHDDTLPSYPLQGSNTMLERLYNLKSDGLSQPLVQIATTSVTHCVYSTPTITTAVLQDPAYCAEPFHASSLEPASEYPLYAGTSEEVSRICDFTAIGEQDMTLRKYHEAMRESTSSCESPEMTATIPEMVEDALELISQDGDYMERINMDIRMQCILCSWAGSKITLEHHIREEHASEITQQEKDEWNVTYKLGNLVNQEQWLSHVCERDGMLYVVSVKYEDPDRLMASLSTLTRTPELLPKLGTITLYNKVTGEPYSWHGSITELDSNMPYENDPNCLRLQLSRLELLPNSANIKLHNRSLVLNSPCKVVIGQPELNDIHIIIFVKIHDV